MNKKTTIFITVLILALATLACNFSVSLPENSFNTLDVPVAQQINIPYPNSANTTNLSINFGMGNLNISSGSSQLVTGLATYNLEDIAPVVESTNEYVTLSTGDVNYTFGNMPNFNNIKNEWNLTLGSAPISLNLSAGAYKGDIDLGGLALTNLDIQGGASKTDINFSSPNLTRMNELKVFAGASDTSFTNLANANFNYLRFEGGAGNYSFDFGGSVQGESSVVIRTGISNVKITIPSGTSAELRFNGALGNVNLGGEWQQVAENQYVHAGNTPLLSFDIDLGLGNLTLK
jgi:hypothetical protein